MSPASSNALLLTSCLLVSQFSVSPAFVAPLRVKPTSLHLALLFGGEDNNSAEDVRKSIEFKDLGEIHETEARRQRLQRDIEAQARFEPFGDDLWDLRTEMESLSNKLIDAINSGDEASEKSTRKDLRACEQRDPELAYQLSLAEYELAVREDKDEEAQIHKERCEEARSCLPQFNLDGMWVGKYGNSYDLINITYVDDTLIAHKVTGEANVPRGAVSFKVDLHPFRGTNRKESLQPIVLTERAAKKWGTSKLARYSGEGQVAETGFSNAQFIDGQLIIIGTEYFSFAWLPIEQQIFFGRPSPELALKMLRDAGVTRVPESFDVPPSLTDDIRVLKDFVTRCLEKTHDHEDEFLGTGSAYGGIWHCDETGEECYFE